jgi:hypothetical protein
MCSVSPLVYRVDTRRSLTKHVNCASLALRDISLRANVATVTRTREQVYSVMYSIFHMVNLTPTTLKSNRAKSVVSTSNNVEGPFMHESIVLLMLIKFI